MNMYVKTTRGIVDEMDYNNKYDIPLKQTKNKVKTFKFKLKKKST